MGKKRKSTGGRTVIICLIALLAVDIVLAVKLIGQRGAWEVDRGVLRRATGS